MNGIIVVSVCFLFGVFDVVDARQFAFAKQTSAEMRTDWQGASDGQLDGDMCDTRYVIRARMFADAQVVASNQLY